MSLRPVDMQTLIPRSSEVSRVQQLQQQQPNVDQQQFAAALREQVDQRNRQVTHAEPGEGGKVNADGHGNGSGGGQEPDRRQKPPQPGRSGLPEGEGEPGKGLRLDRRV